MNKTFVHSKPLPPFLTLIKVDDAYACFAQLLEFYDQIRLKEPKIEQPSFIADKAIIGEDVYVGAFAYISDHSKIGKM